MHNHSSFKPAQRNKEDIQSSKPNFSYMKTRSRNCASKKGINRNRLEICQKIYTTEDFRVKNLHRKRVIFDIC